MRLVNQEDILTFFHLCDNDSYVPRGQAGCKPVSKLSTIYSVVTAKFSSVGKSGKMLCINEGIIPFREKLISIWKIACLHINALGLINCINFPKHYLRIYQNGSCRKVIFRPFNYRKPKSTEYCTVYI